MTDPTSERPTVAGLDQAPGAAPEATPGSVAGRAVPPVPDDAVMIREIEDDRRHERYLVRAALVACVVIAIALAIRTVWG
jgi:hypothetical protein